MTEILLKRLPPPLPSLCGTVRGIPWRSCDSSGPLSSIITPRLPPCNHLQYLNWFGCAHRLLGLRKHLTLAGSGEIPRQQCGVGKGGLLISIHLIRYFSHSVPGGGHVTEVKPPSSRRRSPSRSLCPDGTSQFAALFALQVCAAPVMSFVIYGRPSSGTAEKRLALPCLAPTPGPGSTPQGREGGPAGRPAVRSGRPGTACPVGLAPRPTRRPLAAD